MAIQIKKKLEECVRRTWMSLPAEVNRDITMERKSLQVRNQAWASSYGTRPFV